MREIRNRETVIINLQETIDDMNEVGRERAEANDIASDVSSTD